MLLYENQFSEEHDLPLVDVAQRTLVIASTGRCGSHMLGHALHETGAFGFPLEYLNPANLAEWKRRLGTSSAEETLRQIQRRRTSPNGVFGIKVHYSHLKIVGGFSRLNALLPNARYVNLTRTNLLAQAVSLSIASQTGVWIAGQQPINNTPIYRYSDIDHNMRRIALDNASWRYTLAAHGCKKLDLTFELARTDIAAAIRDIAAFAEVSVDTARIPMEQATKKQANDLNGEWIRRFLEEYKESELLPKGATDPPSRVRRLVSRLLGR